MKILIDGDGCPVIDIAISVAKKFNIEVVIMCDTSHIFNKEGAKTMVFSKGADFLAKNGDKISGALNSAAQKLSKKDTQTQSNPQVARTTTTGTVASAAQMNELARRKKMMGL